MVYDTHHVVLDEKLVRAASSSRARETVRDLVDRALRELVEREEQRKNWRRSARFRAGQAMSAG